MPPLILKGNRHPVPSYYSQSHSDWKKAYKYRGYKASDFAAGNKATNELPTSNRPATQTSGELGSDMTHAQKFATEHS
jgi:hypothetical protein